MRRGVLVSLLLTGAPSSGCSNDGVWVELDPGLSRMLKQPRYDAFEESSFFKDGRAMQHPPEGTVPRGTIVDQARTRGYLGPLPSPGQPQNPQTPAETYVDTIPERVDQELLQLGRGRFDIYCAPCHGILGDGDSVVSRNMPLVRPPSLHLDYLLSAPPGRIYRVINEGYGMMPGYDYQLSVRERWAVVAYVQALQLSQNARLDALPEPLQSRARRALEKEATP